MVEIPFFVYSLADELTLCDYEAGIEVSVDRIRERSIKEARKYNYYLPDYVFRNRFDSESEELLQPVITNAEDTIIMATSRDAIILFISYTPF